jgi:hypothetical protein
LTFSAPKQFRGDHDVELWQRDRKIATLGPSGSPKRREVKGTGSQVNAVVRKEFVPPSEPVQGPA